MYKNFLLPSSILAGAIVGAGMFALPFVFNSLGFGIGFFYLIIAAIVYSLVYLMYADIILRTYGEHRFVGFSKIYLGVGGFWATITIAVLNMILVMGIFLVLSVSFANLIFPSGGSVIKMLIFWLGGSIAIFLPPKRIFLIEFLIVVGMAGIILLVFLLGFGNFKNLASLNFSFNPENILPYAGVILFSLSGRVAVSSLVNYFKKQKVQNRNFLIKKNIIAATFIPVIFYIFFILGIYSLSEKITPDAVTGLIGNAPTAVLSIIGILGLLSLWSTYILIGVNVKSIMRYDLKFPLFLSFLSVTIAPIIIFFASVQDFIGLVSLSGGVFLALEGIFLTAIWLNTKRISQKSSILLPKAGVFAAVFSIIIFAAVLISELLNMFS